MNETMLLTGMICLTVIALALIGSKIKEAEKDDSERKKP